MLSAQQNGVTKLASQVPRNGSSGFVPHVHNAQASLLRHTIMVHPCEWMRVSLRQAQQSATEGPKAS